MYRLAISALIFLINTACFAQIKPTPRMMQEVADESMVINDRGSKLEVLATLRATKEMSTSNEGKAHSVFKTSQSAPISVKQLGVVFNHAMQVQGYITGEISFKLKDALQAMDWPDKSSYPGLARLTAPNIYLVVARTPAEFVQLTKRLQSRPDMEWVEPIVVYGNSQ